MPPPHLPRGFCRHSQGWEETRAYSLVDSWGKERTGETSVNSHNTNPSPWPWPWETREATSSKPVCLGGNCLHPYCLPNIPEGPSRGFPFSCANERAPASPPHPPQVVAQDRAEGIRSFEIWMRAQPLLAVIAPLTEHGRVRSSSPAVRGTPTQLPGWDDSM